VIVADYVNWPSRAHTSFLCGPAAPRAGHRAGAVRFLAGSGSKAIVTMIGEQLYPIPFHEILNPATGKSATRAVCTHHPPDQRRTVSSSLSPFLSLPPLPSFSLGTAVRSLPRDTLCDLLPTCTAAAAA